MSLEGTLWLVVLCLGESGAYCGWLSQWPSLYKGKAVARMSVQCLQANIGMEPSDWSGQWCLQADFGLSFAQDFGLTLVALGIGVLMGMP